MMTNLNIPSFLERSKDGTFTHPEATVPTIEITATVVDSTPIDPVLLIKNASFRKHVKDEIKAGRVRKSWLNDETTLKLLLDGFKARGEEKKARRKVAKENRELAKRRRNKC
jgi:hypothetical protein